MRKTKKRFLSALLACAMIISLFPFAAFAGETSQTITAGNLSQLQEAIANAKNGDTIKLTANIELDANGLDGTKISNKTLTIDGNDKKISFNYDQSNPKMHAVFGNDTNALYADTNLTVKNLTIENTADAQGGYASIVGYDATGSEITYEGCTFVNLYASVYVGPIRAVASGEQPSNGIELNISGCHFDNTKYGYAVSTTEDGTLPFLTKVNFDDTNTGNYAENEVATKIVYAVVDQKGTVEAFSTIQDAVDKAVDGSTITVAPGTYNGNIIFGDKSLTIKAQYPAYENGKKETDESKLSKFTGTFNTYGTDSTSFNADQTIIIDGFALSGQGLKIGNNNYNSVGNLEVRHCTMTSFDGNLDTAESYNQQNYFVKLNGNNGDPYASVIVEDNYVAGTPVTNVYPIQLWDVDNAVVRNNVIKLTSADNFEAVGISKMAENATVDVSGNTISGAGTAVSVTTWLLNGDTQDGNTNFKGTITVTDNMLSCPEAANQTPIFIGYKNTGEYGLLGGTINTSNNTNNGKAVEAVLGQKEGAPVNMLTATFNYNNGEPVDIIRAAISDGKATITTPATPTREGYTFKGWVANGKHYNANTSVTITEDTTFTADWEAPFNGKYSYAINVANMDNGSVSVDKYATEGEKVTLTVSPDKAYKLDELTVTANGKDVELTDNGDGTYTFTMPSSNVKVSASFVEDKDYVEPDNSITVSMTIGSNDFVINNNIVTVPDAAPYIANDRTYVPFRALGEALGAKVVWDNDARTVTYTLGDTEIVMTIGDTTYTINGVEKSMDVAPEITGDRTYVPVRFVAEGLGFKVTPLYADNGTTTSVVFEK